MQKAKRQKVNKALQADSVLGKFFKPEPEIAVPQNTIRVQIENYDADDHPYFDTTQPSKIIAMIESNRASIRDFDDSGLSPEQTSVRDALLESTKTTLVTGEAGTGKTFVQLSLLKRLKLANRLVYRLGPTHGSIANQKEDSGTYQSFFSMQVGTDYCDKSKFEKNVKHMTSAAGRHLFIQRAKHRGQAVVIIEEAAMISAEVMDLIFETFHRLGKFTLILFFDLLQLAPVQGKILIESLNIRDADTLILRTNMRQADDDFLDLLRAVARGTFDPTHYMMLKSRVRKDTLVYRRLCARNLTVDAHNMTHLNDLPAQKFTVKAKDEGKKRMPDYSQAKMPKNLSWCVGAKIVFESSNLHEVGLYNGITGTIIDKVGTNIANFFLPVIHITRYDINIVVHPVIEEILTDCAVPSVQAERHQFPFSIAEATTIHKVQGQTIPFVSEVDFENMNSPGQVYTALSRLTRIEDLIVKNLPHATFEGGLQNLKVNPVALQWCRSRQLFAS